MADDVFDKESLHARLRAHSELHSLASHFSRDRRIELVPVETGIRYRVWTPALFPVIGDSSMLLCGSAAADMDTWGEAKEKFLRSFQDSSNPSPATLLTLRVNDKGTIAFTPFSDFDPVQTPDLKTLPVPDAARKYLGFSNDVQKMDPSQHTFAQTTANPDWRTELFSFIEDYLGHEGRGAKKELGINRLDNLTPKQAAALSSRIVLDLTKYYKDYKSSPGTLTRADQSSATEILEEGLKHRHDPAWEGNGVCCNFADTVKAVFEALKVHQTDFSRLNNTYCLFVGESGSSNGMRSNSFMPKRDDWQRMSMDLSPGHAWNMFFTVGPAENIDVSIIDVTWVNRHQPGPRQMQSLDHTATRMEPIVAAIAGELDRSAESYPAQASNIAMFYARHLEVLSHSQGEFAVNERAAFTSRALEFAGRQDPRIPFPAPFVKEVLNFWKTSGSHPEPHEIESLHHICQSSPWNDFHSILKSWADKESLNDYHARRFLFQDDNLQRQVFDLLKARDDFEKTVRESPDLYKRMMEIHPVLYNQFSPDTDPRDAKALEKILESSNGLRKFAGWLRYGGTFSTAYVQKIVSHVRDTLRTNDPENYQRLENANDYALIARFESLQKAAVPKHYVAVDGIKPS